MKGLKQKRGVLILPAVILIVFSLIWLAACSEESDSDADSEIILDSEKIYLITDDTPNCSLIISDETFNFLSNNDDYSYILDMMSDYFNVIINKEIEPNNVYIKAVSEKIDAEVRLAQIYDPSNKVSLLIKVAEAGGSVFNEYEIDSEDKPEYKPAIQDNPFYNELRKSMKTVADKGSICSVSAMKEAFIEKTRQIYHSSDTIISDNNVESLKYNDYYIDVNNETGITIVCGSNETVVAALDYFLTEYIEMGTSADGSYSISVPDSKIHVGNYLNDTIAGKPVSEFGIVYNCNSTYYDSRENAKYLKDYLLKNYGVSVPVRNTDGSDRYNNNDIKYKFVLGKCLMDVSKSYYKRNPDVMDYRITQNGNELYLMGGSDWAIKYAIDYMIDEFLSKEKPVPQGYSKSGNFSGEYIFPYYGDSNLRIMSSNVWNNFNNNDWYEMGENSADHFRYKNMARVYLAYAPDIISFQELLPTSYYSGALLEEINSGGGKYKYADGYMVNEFVTRNHTPIIYNTRTLELLDSGSYVFPYGNNNGSKSYTWGYFNVKKTGYKFIVFSTHLWWKREAVWAGSTQLRIDQMTEICKQANSLIKKYSCSCFVMGDFNCKSTSKEFSTMLGYKFSDCHEIATDYSSNSSGRYICNDSSFSYKPNAGTYKKNSIDHIMVKNLKKASVVSYNYANPNFYGRLSDHAPVYIDVKTRPSEET